MIFKIIFRVLEKSSILPLSYQYELSSWIYRLIQQGDSDFSQFLHQKGYVMGNKHFKLFTFSNVYVSRYKILDDRMKILSDEISFFISFYVDKAAESMVMSLFSHQDLRLGDEISQVRLRVTEIQCIAVQVPDGALRFKTLSPIVVSKPSERVNGRLIAEYLSPRDSDFERIFVQNLQDKYESAVRAGLASPLQQPETTIRFKLLSENPKPRLIRIKAHTPEETKIKGYMFDFELDAPKELIRCGLLAGFGEKGSQGFGCARIKKGGEG
ncbi:MAG: CRISPR-associated endoribonuclease Cas6 [Microscillaceae bacterium]|nr:CRISPR-associated endoribonuclease Cas6 [Microscillaceae bacterium]